MNLKEWTKLRKLTKNKTKINKNNKKKKKTANEIYCYYLTDCRRRNSSSVLTVNKHTISEWEIGFCVQMKWDVIVIIRAETLPKKRESKKKELSSYESATMLEFESLSQMMCDCAI